jgi:glycosyltransferase involved in cell wall biosynthesis
MLRYRAVAACADVAHFQWLTLPRLDAHLLPKRSSRPKLVYTAHEIEPKERHWGAGRERLWECVDAIVVHSQRACARLRAQGVDEDRIAVIPHGVLTPWVGAPAPLEPPFAGFEGQVVLFVGLLRPYKGVDELLDAWLGMDASARLGAELWIVGMGRMDTTPLRDAIARHGEAGGVRLWERFVSDGQLHALLQRAALVVLPYREIDQSGVAFTALGAHKPLLLSDVGDFPELASTGAAVTFESGRQGALRAQLERLLADEDGLSKMADSARALCARAGPYAWDSIAKAHIDLYERLLGENG